MSTPRLRGFFVLQVLYNFDWSGPLAHLVEHFICNEEVASSSLARSTLKAFSLEVFAWQSQAGTL